MSNFFEFLFILIFVTKKLHAQCACRLENLLAQRKECMHLCKRACVKSSTVARSNNVTLNSFVIIFFVRLHMYYIVNNICEHPLKCLLIEKIQN